MTMIQHIDKQIAMYRVQGFLGQTRCFFPKLFLNSKKVRMDLKGMTLDHDFYVVVGKQWRTENAYTGHQHNIFI